MALHLTNGQAEEMIRHARREYPDEACGLLAGKACPEQSRRDGRVEKVYQMTNAAHSPVTYRLDPEEQYRAFMEIEEDSQVPDEKEFKCPVCGKGLEKMVMECPECGADLTSIEQESEEEGA